jgi:hypothetical protein
VTNVYLHPRYDEHLTLLALGIEPVDALSGRRLGGSVAVLVEDHPVPLHRWRTWRPGETLDTVLGGLDRHASGRFGRSYGRDMAGGTVVVRIVDRPAGGGTAGRPLADRRIVPRRLEIDVADEATVQAADTDPAGPPHPVWRRVWQVGLFPGAGVDVPGRATVVRGRVVRLVSAATGEVAPVPWARVSAVDTTGAAVGWAHGDDRGEFVLVIGNADTSVVVPADPLDVELSVGATLPAAAPSPLDPLRPVVDPLWDLPAEPLPAVAAPDPLDPRTGRVLLPGQSTFGPFPFALPLGRETSAQIQIA